MVNPVYIGTLDEVLGESPIIDPGKLVVAGGDGCAAVPFLQGVEPGVLAAVDKLSRRKEYWLREDGQLVWRVPDIREAVRAPKGRKIFSADYSQIEVKIMAWLSQDPFFIAAILSGKDIHSYIASEVFGIPYDDFAGAVGDKSHPKHKEYSKTRSNIKVVTFGIPYGASAKRVALMTGMTEEEAQDFINQYFLKACVLKTWLDALRKDAVQNRCSRSPRGRVRWYDVPPRKDPNYRKVLGQIERFAGNHPIQAGCVDLLKPAMAYFYLALRGAAPFYSAIGNNGSWASDKLYPHAALLLAVHDELVGECDEADAGRTCNCKAVNKPKFAASGCFRNCVGPVPQLLKQSMEFAYNELTAFIKSRDEDGKLTRQEIYIRDIPNKVDVVVNDYWSKE